MSTLSSIIDELKALPIEKQMAVLESLPQEDREAIAKLAFDLTADMAWVPNPGPQTMAYNSDVDQLLYGGSAGGGKMVCIRTEIPTPKGWTLMGDIAVGDTVFDQDGNLTTVTAVSPIKQAKSYRLTFDDGSKIECCADHRWLTYTSKDLGDLRKRTDEWKAKRRAKRPSQAGGNKSALFTLQLAKRNAIRAALAESLPPPTGAVRTTQQIVDTLRVGKRTNHAIPVAKPLDTPPAAVLIRPYTLGAWLGDGSRDGGRFTGVDEGIWKRIEEDGYRVTHGVADLQAHHIADLKHSLFCYGLLGNKHIPPIYLRGSFEQRLDLLCGIMDTDGHATLDGACEFDNTNKRLIDDTYELIVSLGIKATVTEGVAKLNGRVTGPKWRINFATNLPVFALPRKLERLNPKPRQTTKFRYIVDAVEIEPIPMRCIAVDSPSHLYLAGRSMIPTHNTDLGIAKALQRHKRSLILRRINKEVGYLVQRTEEILGHKTGYNGQDDIWKLPGGRIIQYGGCQHPGDEQAYKGQPKDLAVFDEASGFLESQVRYIMTWLRTTDPNQKTQALFPTNPPDGPEGDWIIRWWAPWVDRNHPLYPMPYGKPLWFRERDGEIEWREEPWSWQNDQGTTVRALSRTFIRAFLSDNPEYARTDYASQLEGLPEELRRRYSGGEFVTEGKDAEFQVIPSAWVRAAQDRWKPEGRSKPMTSMGCDVARGGPDESTIAKRHGSWVDELVVKPGSETPDGPQLAALVIINRRDSAAICIDTGGGWGGSPLDNLVGNEIKAKGINPSAGSNGTTKDAARLKFRNLRAEMWWRLREALDPSGDDPLALPKDQKLFADLIAPRWKNTSAGILIEAKDEIRKRIGRSPDRGDAVALTTMANNDLIAHARTMSLMGRPGSELPKSAKSGYSTFKDKMRAFRGRR